MKLNQWQNIFNVIANANWIVQHAIQMKNGIIIMIHINVSVKIIAHVKNVIVGIVA